MTAALETQPYEIVRPGSAADLAILIDPEFAAMVPPPGKSELAKLERSLRTYSCLSPLVLWTGNNVLVDGYTRLPLCRRYDIPFPVVRREFTDRDAAKQFLLDIQLGRRNLTTEAVSYLRGERYLAEKQDHGGVRTKREAIYQNDRLATAARLAREYKVSEVTINRDAVFARAVNVVAANCGFDAKQAILSRDRRLTRTTVQWIAKQTAEKQQAVMTEWLEHGTLPRREDGKCPTWTLPADPRALANKLLTKRGPKVSVQVRDALTEVLRGMDHDA